MEDLAKIVRRRRMAAGLTLKDLAETTGVSLSYIGRIERGERFPSASVLRRFAGPLGFSEAELFRLAGFLTAPAAGPKGEGIETIPGLDPLVAQTLASESVETQRAVLGILSLLKSLTLGLHKQS